ncbi:hypothetical protein [Ottowia sp.]|uniref:hypothetical protein n=1 Tax=Ottowia sp. TaxID=1898956 RepID=UPI002BCDE21D|nr:hypothetical protein [Ottowia sp.]HOB67455.1 hypothetical protein [Ottowia sp.]HPZ56311.1 hypothetical protein [Ottowia sp.]HQD47554.1 hypothetical protein [Ottowia sp.]
MNPRHIHLLAAAISGLAGMFGSFKVWQALSRGYYIGKRNIVYSTDAGFDFVMGAGAVLSVLALALTVLFVCKALRD